MKTPTVLGLDLSLAAPAAVVLYKGWRPGDWSFRHMRAKCWAKEIEEHKEWHAGAYGAEWWPAERLDWIGKQVATFARDNGATHAFVEGYAFGRQQNREALAELGGVVKRDLYARLNLMLEPVAANSARKTLLGHVPSKKASGIAVKDYVNHQLAKMGAKFATMDEGDAFVIANHGRMLLGLPHVGVGG